MNNEIVIGAIFFILSLIPAYYFYVKSIRNKEPVCSIKSNNLISGSVSTLDKLLIEYNNQRIQNLTVSKILFYNRGSETISKQDIQTINPLIISSDTCNIMDASLLQANYPSNNFSVTRKIETEDVFIDFDYIDKNQGAVIQIIHTGLSSEDLNINGDIKGVQKLIQVPPEYLVITQPMKSQDKTIWVVAILLAVIFMNSVSKGGYLNLIANSTDNPFKGIVQIIAFISAISTFALVAVIGANILGFITGLFVPSNKIPEGLEKFAE